MLHKRSAALIIAVSVPALAGCVQATRHSNTMVFGTSTTVGLKAGQNVNQVPEILVAYDRQEAVIMPLLANTQEYGGLWESLSPCDPVASKDSVESAQSSIRQIVRDETATYTKDSTAEDVALHPCKFVGIRKGKEDFLIQDSYSVLASFGARIEGKGSTGEGAVGLAQYFATGAAAQTLAITGGAAVVSVGDATGKAVDNKDNAANAAAALTGADPIPPTVVGEFSGGAQQEKLEKYLDPSLPKAEFDRRLGVAGQAASKVNLGSSAADIYSLTIIGSNENRSKLIGAIKALETDAAASAILD